MGSPGLHAPGGSAAGCCSSEMAMRNSSLRSPESGFSLGLASKKCPSCGSANVQRSSFRSPEEAELHVFTSPYRCEDCSQRFWVLSRKARHAMIWIAVLVITTVTISSLIPMPAPRVPEAPSRGAIVFPDVSG